MGAPSSLSTPVPPARRGQVGESPQLQAPEPGSLFVGSPLDFLCLATWLPQRPGQSDLVRHPTTLCRDGAAVPSDLVSFCGEHQIEPFRLKLSEIGVSYRLWGAVWT